MEMQNILMLIQAFTDHSLTELSVEDGGVKVCLKRDRRAAVSGVPIPAVPTVGNVLETSAGAQMAMVAGAGAMPVVPVSGTAAGTGIVGNGVGTAGMTVVPAVGAASAAMPVAGVQTAVSGAVSVGNGAVGAAVSGTVPVGSGVIGAAVPVGSGAIGAAVPGTVSVGSGVVGAAVPGAVPVGNGAVGAAAAVIPGGGIAAAGIQTTAAVADAAGISSDNVVVSPLVGIFYSASSPEAEAFVKVGDRVKKGQVLGIIEAMKLMNEIESEYDGVVEAILVKNEEVVEYGQPLFRIR